MSRWFRSYDDALDDSKVQQLPGELFKAWFNLLCLTSQNKGKPFPLSEVAFRLRLTDARAKAVVKEFVTRGLLDEIDGGYISHNWDARQFKSDVSNERVKRFRERQCNVTETPDETPPEAETETDKIERETRASAPLISPDAFDLSKSILDTIGVDQESPDIQGFPYIVQMWLAEKIPKDFIISTCANTRVKHQKYLDKAVRNGWRDREIGGQVRKDSPHAKPRQRSAIMEAIDQHAENFRQSERDNGFGETPTRLLSHG